MTRGRPRHPDLLTPAEWRVVHAIRHGMTNAAIGRRLAVTLDAVKYHVQNARGKLGLDSRADLRNWHGAPIDSAHQQRRETMPGMAGLGPIGQISRQVQDIEAAVAAYADPWQEAVTPVHPQQFDAVLVAIGRRRSEARVAGEVL